MYFSLLTHITPQKLGHQRIQIIKESIRKLKTAHNKNRRSLSNRLENNRLTYLKHELIIPSIASILNFLLQGTKLFHFFLPTNNGRPRYFSPRCSLEIFTVAKILHLRFFSMLGLKKSLISPSLPFGPRRAHIV